MSNSMLNEKKKLDLFSKFKNSILDCCRSDQSDDYLMKWLIARNYDVKAAEIMFRKSMLWRHINGIDGLLENWQPPEVINKYYSVGTCGYDKFGCPVWITACGRIDFKGILQSTSSRNFIRFFVFLMEKTIRLMQDHSQLTNKKVTYKTLILDMEELSFRQITFKPYIDVTIELTRLFEANYPEDLRRVFLINVPSIFTMLFAMIKPLLSPVTLDKIRIFGSDNNEWKTSLLAEIDADQLPAFYGGTMTDPDGNPMCLSIINMGGEVPRSYYLTRAKLIPKKNMKPFLIAPGAKTSMEFEVKQPDSTLKWEFMTEEKDIDFRIYFEDIVQQTNMEVIEKIRVDSSLMIEEGEIICPWQGTYVVEFSNSFSYVRTKKLWHRIVLKKPSGI